MYQMPPLAPTSPPERAPMRVSPATAVESASFDAPERLQHASTAAKPVGRKGPLP